MTDTGKVRPAIRMVEAGEISRETFIIEICFRDRWLPLGDKSGVFTFDTEEERDTALNEFKARSENKETVEH
jgi:hypothetical protein